MKEKLHITRVTRVLLLALLVCSLVALLTLPALASGEGDIEYFDDTQTPAVDGTPESEVEENAVPASEGPADEAPADETPATEVPADEAPVSDTPADDQLTGNSDQAQLEPVTDLAGLLTGEQIAQLTELAEKQEAETGCALYVVTVEDYSRYIEVGDVYDCATAIFTTYDLGWGADRDGVLLLLSLADRDYALTVHGQRTDGMMDTEAMVWLEDEFLPALAEDDWYNGFRIFLEDSGYILSGNEPLLSASGDYNYGAERSGGFLGAVKNRLPKTALVSLFIAFITTLAMKGKMKSVSKKVEARRYLTGPAELSVSEDRYTHQTESRRLVESNNSTRSGGVSHSGGGFSGRSGKF